MGGVRRPQSLVLAAGFAVLGFVLVTAVSSTGAARRAAEPRKGQLIDLISRRRSLVAEEDTAVRALRAEVAAAQRQVSRRSEQDRASAVSAATLAMQAGPVASRAGGARCVCRSRPGSRRARSAAALPASATPTSSWW